MWSCENRSCESALGYQQFYRCAPPYACVRDPEISICAIHTNVFFAAADRQIRSACAAGTSLGSVTDPASLTVAIIAAVIAAVGAVTGIVALVQGYEMRTKPRLEFAPIYVHDMLRYGSKVDEDDPDSKMQWWNDVGKKIEVRNWGNGTAYDVRLHTADGVTTSEDLLGNIEPGKSVEQNYRRVTGPDREPKAWVTWHTYPGPQRKRHDLKGGWGIESSEPSMPRKRRRDPKRAGA
jgi:hypothetical protein